MKLKVMPLYFMVSNGILGNLNFINYLGLFCNSFKCLIQKRDSTWRRIMATNTLELHLRMLISIMQNILFCILVSYYVVLYLWVFSDLPETEHGKQVENTHYNFSPCFIYFCKARNKNFLCTFKDLLSLN